MTGYENINKVDIDGNRYSISKHDDGEITFHRIVREVSEDFDLIDVPNDDLTHDARNPLKVVRIVAYEIRNWIKRKEPHYIWFEANDIRKRRIYERLFNRAIITMPEYHYEYQDGRYHLYKKRVPPD